MTLHEDEGRALRKLSHWLCVHRGRRGVRLLEADLGRMRRLARSLEEWIRTYDYDFIEVGGKEYALLIPRPFGRGVLVSVCALDEWRLAVKARLPVGPGCGLDHMQWKLDELFGIRLSAQALILDLASRHRWYQAARRLRNEVRRSGMGPLLGEVRAIVKEAGAAEGSVHSARVVIGVMRAIAQLSAFALRPRETAAVWRICGMPVIKRLVAPPRGPRPTWEARAWREMELAEQWFQRTLVLREVVA